MIRNKERVRSLGEVFTPNFIIDEMLELIPENVWSDPEYYFIEPSCGNGNFLEKIYNKRIKSGINEEIANKTLIGIDISEINIKECKERVNCVLILGDFFDIKFDYNKIVILGNPPYQKQTENQLNRKTNGNQQAKPFYNIWIEHILDNIKPDYLSFIIPSRWMVGGMGLNKFRQRMKNDKRLKVIKHFKNSKQIFPNNEIEGGICYFLLDKSYDGKCLFNNVETDLKTFDIIVKDEKAKSIIEKLLDFKKIDYILSQNSFNINSNFSDWDDEGIICWSMRKQKYYISESKFTDKNNILEKYKVCYPKAASFSLYNNLGQSKIMSPAFIIQPNEICTESYLVLNSFDTLEECYNFISYQSTKIFRYLLSLRVSNQNICRNSFLWIPELTYEKSWNDEELYEKFNLSKEEIDHIEFTILS